MKRMCNIFERKIAVECAKKRCGRKKALFGEEAQTPEAALTTSGLCVFSSNIPPWEYTQICLAKLSTLKCLPENVFSIMEVLSVLPSIWIIWSTLTPSPLPPLVIFFHHQNLGPLAQGWPLPSKTKRLSLPSPLIPKSHIWNATFTLLGDQ